MASDCRISLPASNCFFKLKIVLLHSILDYLFNKYLFGAYYVLDTALGAWYTLVKKKKIPSPWYFF